METKPSIYQKKISEIMGGNKRRAVIVRVEKYAAKKTKGESGRKYCKQKRAQLNY